MLGSEFGSSEGHVGTGLRWLLRLRRQVSPAEGRELKPDSREAACRPTPALPAAPQPISQMEKLTSRLDKALAWKEVQLGSGPCFP